jgi:hypothetical protein
MDGWTIYWILKLDVLGDLCVATCMLSFISIAASACIFLYWKQKRPYYRYEKTENGNATEHFTETKRLVLSYSKRCLIACIILFFVSLPPATFLPTTKQACVIYVLPKITNNTHVQEIPNNISKLVNEKLVEWIDDVRGIKKAK